MKKYEKTHPWIDFFVDTRKASHETWLLLGEAQSKCKHIAGALLEPKTALQMQLLYLAKGARATTAIEGNTLSEEQVQAHIAGELELPESKEYLGQEIDNVVDACNMIADSHFQGEGVALCVDEIKEFDRLVLKDLPLEEGILPGELRHYSVTVGRYQGAPAEDLQFLLEKMCMMLEGGFFSLGARWPIASGILKAVVAHLYIAWIHPFGDGNGRTARLVEFKLCISAGIPAPAAHLLSNHYNETRSEYYRALDATSKTRDPFRFVNYALAGYVDQLEEQIKNIRQSQTKIFWVNYVYTVFKGRDGSAEKRRRNLILDLSERAFPVNGWIDTSKIERTSPRVMKDYLTIKPKTKARDISSLIQDGLLERKGNQIRPNLDAISAYLPQRVNNASQPEARPSKE